MHEKQAKELRKRNATIYHGHAHDNGVPHAKRRRN